MMQKRNEISRAEKRRKKRDPVSMILLSAIIILVMFIGVSFLKEFLFSLGIQEENEQLRKDFTIEENGDREINFSELQEVNEDICGWIVLDDTSIDFPLVQGGDNMEYLNKNAYGEAAIYGAIFLDSRNQTDFSDPFSILYGHHMKDGNMFGDIDLFEKETFFRTHESGTLYTPQAVFALKTIAYILTDCEDPYIFTPEQWREKDKTELYTYMNQKSMYISSEIDKIKKDERTKVLALSTCSIHGDRQRSVLLLEVLPVSDSDL